MKYLLLGASLFALSLEAIRGGGGRGGFSGRAGGSFSGSSARGSSFGARPAFRQAGSYSAPNFSSTQFRGQRPGFRPPTGGFQARPSFAAPSSFGANRFRASGARPGGQLGSRRPGRGAPGYGAIKSRPDINRPKNPDRFNRQHDFLNNNIGKTNVNWGWLARSNYPLFASLFPIAFYDEYREYPAFWYDYYDANGVYPTADPNFDQYLSGELPFPPEGAAPEGPEQMEGPVPGMPQGDCQSGCLANCMQECLASGELSEQECVNNNCGPMCYESCQS